MLTVVMLTVVALPNWLEFQSYCSNKKQGDTTLDQMKFVLTIQSYTSKYHDRKLGAYPSGAALNASLAKINSVKRYKRTSLFKTLQKGLWNGQTVAKGTKPGQSFQL